jgi:cytochrome c
MQSMKTSFVLAAAVLAATALPVHADEAMAKAKGCTACHGIDKKVIGPAYKDVAKKYKGEKDASAKLEASILKGSTGKWGPIPMPANKVSADEAKKLAAWVLSL